MQPAFTPDLSSRPALANAPIAISTVSLAAAARKAGLARFSPSVADMLLRVQEMLSQKAAHPSGTNGQKKPWPPHGKTIRSERRAAVFLLGEKGTAALPVFRLEETGRGTAKPDEPGWRLPAERTDWW